MATSGSVRAEERRGTIVELVNSNGSVALEKLAETAQVSLMTIRRDLDDLEAEGLLRRVRGGAVAIGGPRLFGERRAVRTRAKQVIAAKAAQFLPTAGAIALDASSTVGTMAAAINAIPGITVATNSWENFNALRANTELTTLLIGGEQELRTGSFVGKVACDGAASLRYGVFFTSATGVDPALGTSEATLAESQVKQAFAACARRTVLCIDSSKLDSIAVAATFDLSTIDTMITELDPADAQLDPYRALTNVL